MIEGRDIVVIGIQPWDIEIGSNCKDIAIEFSNKNRVLYVNSPWDKINLKKQKNSNQAKTRLKSIKDSESSIQKIKDNLWVLNPSTTILPVNFLPKSFIFNAFNFLNNKIFSKHIKKALNVIDFNNILLFNDQNMFLGYYQKKLLKPLISIYYIRDNLLNVPYWRKHGEKLEPQLIASSDLVFTNSLLYEENARKYNSHSFMVGQGCDTSLYQDNITTVDPAIEKFSGPIVGYIGYLSSKRLDINIIEYIANQKKEYNIILVGPEDDEFKSSSLHKMKNVHFLGSKHPKELPGFIKGFDVAINPQKYTKATSGNYPRKIDEYLAMGKPTVASATKAMEYFKDVVYLAKTKEEYIEKIDIALKEDSTENVKKRTEIGHSHSWSNCVNMMYGLITNYLKRNS